jgi:hypothetical protein
MATPMSVCGHIEDLTPAAKMAGTDASDPHPRLWLMTTPRVLIAKAGI